MYQSNRQARRNGQICEMYDLSRLNQEEIENTNTPPPLERSHHTRRAFLILAVSAALLGWKRALEMVQPEAVSGGEAWRAAGAIRISGPQQNSSAD